MRWISIVGYGYSARRAHLCRRFTNLLTWPEVVDLYRLTDVLEPPAGFCASYNIAPGQSALVVAQGDHGPEARMMRWGLITAWAKTKPGMTPINARSKTIARSRISRSAFRVRRCLVPASGFYEWQKQPGGREQPYWLGMRGRPSFQHCWNLGTLAWGRCDRHLRTHYRGTKRPHGYSP